jgi:hypothetical protein
LQQPPAIAIEEPFRSTYRAASPVTTTRAHHLALDDSTINREAKKNCERMTKMPDMIQDATPAALIAFIS